VAAFGVVFVRRLIESLASAAGTGLHVRPGGQLNPATVNALPAAVKHDVFFAIAHTVQAVFIWALPAAAAIFALALPIKEVPLRGRVAPPGVGKPPASRPSSVLTPQVVPERHRWPIGTAPVPGRSLADGRSRRWQAHERAAGTWQLP
jgi:hypothetical protein